jgi:protein-S-isoprenylcysteine O-methyltransferase Ste14
MNEQVIYRSLLISWFVVAAVVFVALFFVAAPYGRHVRRGWGYAVGNKLGWVLMEAPASLAFAACFLLGGSFGLASMIFLIMWESHYIHRAFIYPLGLRGTGRRLPLTIIGFGFLFNLMNGYLNGRYLFTLSGGYPDRWLSDPRFIIGLFIFVAGFFINRQADGILRSLRGPDDSGYRMTSRGLYRWVSCPNYLGEITIWVGWAIATWSLAGLAFALWTAANLMPRARANHAWYRENFPDYPPERKALVPRLW